MVVGHDDRTTRAHDGPPKYLTGMHVRLVKQAQCYEFDVFDSVTPIQPHRIEMLLVPINLILGARALAFVRGRPYALPQDVRDLALDVIRHRLVLSYEALADDVSADDLLNSLLNAIPLPEVPLHERAPFPHA